MTTLDNMFRAGRINQEALRIALDACVEGNSLKYIDGLIKGTIEYNGGRPAFLNYQPPGAPTKYPASACISVNDVAVHGVPNEYELQLGDIVTIDIGTEYQGRFADAARTTIVGVPTLLNIDNDLRHSIQKRTWLKEAAESILTAQLGVIKDGCGLIDIVNVSEEEAKKWDVVIMPEWGGHGIRPGLHMTPFIPSTINRRETSLKQRICINQYSRYKLREGDTICLEPVVSFGPQVIIVDEDGWTVRTKGGEDVAHVENCLLVTKTGFKIIS
jgi:methionyl aminopeptidase